MMKPILISFGVFLFALAPVSAAPIVACASVVAALLHPNVTHVAFAVRSDRAALVCMKPDGALTQDPFDGWRKCPGRSTPYVVELCRAGELPPPNTNDTNRARAAAAAKGAIRTATYQGRRFCVRYIDKPFSPDDPIGGTDLP
jgi:hypothetical protein